MLLGNHCICGWGMQRVATVLEVALALIGFELVPPSVCEDGGGGRGEEKGREGRGEKMGGMGGRGLEGIVNVGTDLKFEYKK